MTIELLQVLNEIKFPVRYDDSGIIMDADGKMLLQVRGWGWIQYLKGNSEKMQDDFGKKIADLINDKFENGKSN